MIRAIIIDDEPNAIELISRYISRIPFVECISTFRNALDAIPFIKSNEFDLIFLDVNMPELSGISFLKSITINPKVILTTAYSEYAVESYEYDVEDYLLKPISFERFLKAITQFQEKHAVKAPSTYEQEADQIIYLKDGTNNFKVVIKEILYLKKSGNYMIYVVGEKKIMVRQTVKEALNELGKCFIQIHKSYIANQDHVSSFSNNSINIRKTVLPVGQSFKLEVSRVLRGF